MSTEKRCWCGDQAHERCLIEGGWYCPTHVDHIERHAAEFAAQPTPGSLASLRKQAKNAQDDRENDGRVGGR